MHMLPITKDNISNILKILRPIVYSSSCPIHPYYIGQVCAPQTNNVNYKFTLGPERYYSFTEPATSRL